MKKYLLPQAGAFYKANLHSHSTCSDAALPVEKVAEMYKAHGYSVLAMTDHELLIDHTDLADDDFLLLTAYECSVRDGDRSYNTNSVCHMNFYAKDPHNVKMIQFDRAYSEGYNRHGVVDVDTLQYSTERERPDYSVDTMKNFLRDAKEYGFLCTYNHPTWSNEEQDFFNKLDGFFAMEIVNYSALCEGLWEYNVHEYDQMLRAGKRVGCVATDDNHNFYPEGHPLCDSFGGFTMIKAPSLTYDNIIAALENGTYYASTGPEIFDLYYDTEDEKVHIKTSPAYSIALTTDGRRHSIATSEDGSPITEAALSIPMQQTTYFRLTVNDGKGKYAFSRGYFLDEIGIEAAK